MVLSDFCTGDVAGRWDVLSSKEPSEALGILHEY
jgi:hypothetical protein